jgi:hypothetical protein
MSPWLAMPSRWRCIIVLAASSHHSLTADRRSAFPGEREHAEGRAGSQPMPWWSLRDMSPADLKALYVYVKWREPRVFWRSRQQLHRYVDRVIDVNEE